MHFAFIPYGARTELDLLFRDMEAQKFKLKLIKKGEADKFSYIPGQIRVLPFGVYEYIFPKEYRDIILSSMLENNKPNRFGIPKAMVFGFRKALKLKAMPKFSSKEKFLWTIENVMIAPIGIREDAMLIEPKDLGFKGWHHEAI